MRLGSIVDVESVLAFERKWLGHDRSTGAYEHAVKKTFGVTMTAYAMRLTRLVDDPDAIAADPVTCRLVRARRTVNVKQSSMRAAPTRA